VNITQKIQVVLLLSFFAQGAYCAESTIKAGKEATLTGMVVELTAEPSVTYDEKSHKFIALKLLNPINVLSDSESDLNDRHFAGVGVVQLVQIKTSLPLVKYINKKVSVHCSELFESHSGHHFTDVLCDLNNIGIKN
jgi:hypothetical protein